MDDNQLSEIRVITLNCWGLKFISKLRNERLTEIGRRIAAASPAPHIVAFQELFTQEDFLSICRETRDVLPHAKFYFSGPFGGGLAILSRWPIEESSMFRYPLNGRPAAFWRGDWYVGKGIAHARIRHRPGPGGVIEVFNTHVHAPYEDSYNCHRIAQSWEMAKHIRGACERGNLVLALGDFNMRPGSLHHRIITARAPVRDVWRVLKPDSALGEADYPPEKARGRPVPTAEYNVTHNGVASDSPFCTWRWTGEDRKTLGREGKPPRVVSPSTPDRKGKRLDYIFIGDGRRHVLGPDATSESWIVSSAKVGMVEPHPRLGCSLSDHFSVEATIALHRSSENSESDSHLDHQLSSDYPAAADNLPLSLAVYKDISSTVATYTARQVAQQRSRSFHFFFWLLAWPASLVGVWFVPRPEGSNFISFLLLLIVPLGLVAGTIDGLMALLFHGTELRALRELEWEVTSASAAAAAENKTSHDDDEAANVKDP